MISLSCLPQVSGILPAEFCKSSLLTSWWDLLWVSVQDPQNGTPKAGGPCRCDRCWRRICDQMRSWGGTEKWPRCVSWGGNVVQHWQKEQKQPGVWREAESYSWMFVRLLLCPEGVVPGPVSVNVRSVHHGPWNHARPPTALQGLLWVNGMSRAYWEFHPD